MEIKIALNYILSFLYDKLPRRRVNLFGEELEKYIRLKLSLNWTSFTDQPPSLSTMSKKNSLTLHKPDYVDPCFIAAAKDSAMDLQEMLQYLPDHLRLYISPGLVAFSLTNDQPTGQTDENNNADSDSVNIKTDDVIVLYNKQTSELNSGSLSPSPPSLSTDQHLSLNLIGQPNCASAASPSSFSSASSSSSSSGGCFGKAKQPVGWGGRSQLMGSGNNLNLNLNLVNGSTSSPSRSLIGSPCSSSSTLG